MFMDVAALCHFSAANQLIGFFKSSIFILQYSIPKPLCLLLKVLTRYDLIIIGNGSRYVFRVARFKSRAKDGFFCPFLLVSRNA